MPKSITIGKGRPKGVSTVKELTPKHHGPGATTKTMRQWFLEQNWRELWEDFYLSVEENGKPAYKSVNQFAAAKAKTQEQFRFLKWYLGPKPEGYTDAQSPYPFSHGPQDWAEKRATGGWLSVTNEKGGWSQIRQTMNVLQKVAMVGDRVNLKLVDRWERLLDQLENQTRALILPGLTWEQNKARADAIVELMHEMQHGVNEAIESYMRTQGVNLADMSGLVALMQSPAIAAAQRIINEAPSADEVITSEFARMIMGKVGKFGLPVPDAIETTLAEATQEELKPKSKKDVN